MVQSSKLAHASILLVALIFLWAILPSLAYAEESSTELSATIRAGLLSDPRTTGLSDVQLDAMVDLLTQEATRQGVTSQDIQWRPQQYESTEEIPASADYCGASPAFLCAFSLAFGFAGTDPTMPFALGASSMGLIWIIAEMLHRRRHPGTVSPASSPLA